MSVRYMYILYIIMMILKVSTTKVCLLFALMLIEKSATAAILIELPLHNA